MTPNNNYLIKLEEIFLGIAYVSIICLRLTYPIIGTNHIVNTKSVAAIFHKLSDPTSNHKAMSCNTVSQRN